MSQGRTEALRQLRVQFVELLHTDVLKHKPDVQNNTAGKLVTYLMEQYREFESLLLQTMRRSSDSHIQMEVWHAIMECVRAGDSTVARHGCCRCHHLSRTFRLDMSYFVQTMLDTSTTTFSARLFWHFLRANGRPSMQWSFSSGGMQKTGMFVSSGCSKLRRCLVQLLMMGCKRFALLLWSNAQLQRDSKETLSVITASRPVVSCLQIACSHDGVLS